MGSLRLTLCTGLLAATAATTALAPTAPTAYAADGEGLSVTPSSPTPGTDITLRVTGCADRTGTAASAAFVAEVRLTGPGGTPSGGGTLVGETRVRSEVKVGSYDVQVICGGEPRKGALTVVDKASQPSPYASPVAPVHAGGGGTATSVAASAGPGTAHAVTGLVLAGVAAVAVVLRGSRRRRRSD